MPALGSLADSKFMLAVAFGFVLIVLARWASRTRGTKRDTWVALRIGNVLLTEVVGAFLFGYGLGGLIAPPDVSGPTAPPGTVGRIGRFGGFGGFGPGIPLALAAVAAAIAVLTRIDLSALLVGGSSSRNGMSMYIGSDARVIAPIQAGGYGQITMRDALGYPVSAGATAESDIAQGTPVRVVGTKDLKLLVAPIPSASDTTAPNR